ncbi:membrane-associated protein, putative [Bodo saltans]|uniref:Membrane-associated protein, putative n=1 Tax=Bodo saltans TaxID=75058 RepID=A0A0S4ISC3_BODSA|nr:membrane-associated protein, putative [Bodo saltans]|eukprot:CUF61260.1 membrane-associated protein, putative [Bodo saltans]
MVQRKQALVAASAAFAIGGLAWLALKLTRSRNERLEDDAMFAAPSIADRAPNAETVGTAVVVMANDLPPSPYVADEIRKEAMNTLKTVVLSLGGHVEEADDNDKKDDEADGSYDTDLELELNIGNEMEKILRSKIMDLTSSVFAADGSILDSATIVASAAGKKKTKTSKKQKAPLVELLELTHQYLDLSHERLGVQRKLQAEQSLGGARRIDAGKAPAHISGVLSSRPGGYADLVESDDEDAEAMDWGRGAPRHNRYGYGDDDDDDDAPWRMHGDDDEDDWEDEEEVWDEEDDDEEYDEEYDDEFEAAWARANGQPSVEHAADDAERAEFEIFLIERCMSEELRLLLERSRASGSTKSEQGTHEDEWESESEEEEDRSKKNVKGGKKTSGAKQSKAKRHQVPRGAAAQQQRYENGEWVDF